MHLDDRHCPLSLNVRLMTAFSSSFPPDFVFCVVGKLSLTWAPLQAGGPLLPLSASLLQRTAALSASTCFQVKCSRLRCFRYPLIVRLSSPQPLVFLHHRRFHRHRSLRAAAASLLR
jgi:hypothetical protein